MWRQLFAKKTSANQSIQGPRNWKYYFLLHYNKKYWQCLSFYLEKCFKLSLTVWFMTLAQPSLGLHLTVFQTEHFYIQICWHLPITVGVFYMPWETELILQNCSFRPSVWTSDKQFQYSAKLPSCPMMPQYFKCQSEQASTSWPG